MDKKIPHECKKEYTEKDAYADYGRLLAMRDLRINHDELQDDEWLERWGGPVINQPAMATRRVVNG